MAKSDLPMLAAGGSSGGLAAALALARKGQSVDVLDSFADFRDVSAGICSPGARRSRRITASPGPTTEFGEDRVIA
jgi:2-polyprenyl-6-methoxyphenol hydroxylase-like FAD-dependent oxidoreductase